MCRSEQELCKSPDVPAAQTSTNLGIRVKTRALQALLDVSCPYRRTWNGNRSGETDVIIAGTSNELETGMEDDEGSGPRQNHSSVPADASTCIETNF